MQLIDSLILMLNEMSPYILLGFLIAGVLHAFVPRRAFARHLSGSGPKSVIKAALIGVPLPLCSCGVLPTAIAMRRSGASRAASSAFLISTPQTGVDSIAATWSLLGPAFAVIRPVAALVTALFGGMAVGITDRKEGADATETECGAACSAVAEEPDAPRGFLPRLAAALRYGFVDLVGSIGGWLVAGLLIAALITAFVPADFFASLGSRPLLAMIAVVIVAIPMYVCATGSIPIALSLMLKGLSPGTAFVLLMAGPAANFASFTLIAREMGRKAAALYVGSIVAGALAVGLAIDYLMPAAWFSAPLAMHGGSCHHAIELFPSICSAILVILLAYGFIAHRREHHHHNHQIISNMTQKYNVTGMNCPHCQAAVKKAIESVDGVTAATVDLHTGDALVEGTPDAEAVIAAVHAAGFDATATSI